MNYLDELPDEMIHEIIKFIYYKEDYLSLIEVIKDRFTSEFRMYSFNWYNKIIDFDIYNNICEYYICPNLNKHKLYVSWYANRHEKIYKNGITKTAPIREYIELRYDGTRHGIQKFVKINNQKNSTYYVYLNSNTHVYTDADITEIQINHYKNGQLDGEQLILDGKGNVKFKYSYVNGGLIT